MRIKRIIILTVLILFTMSSVSYASPAYHGYNYSVWGDPVPSPNAYVVDDVLLPKDLGVDNLNNPSDIHIGPNGDFYLVDTGNNRVIVLDPNLKVKRIIDKFDNNGKQNTLKAPLGVFATGTELYIADSQNGRIVVLDQNDKLVKIIGAPVSDVLPPKFVYHPQKLAVDSGGRIFVVAENMNEGLIELDKNGDFNKFFGSNKVKVNPAELLLRHFLTKDQRAKRMMFVPVEYANLTIDNDGFLYTSTKNDRGDQIKRLNATGDNIIRHDGITGPFYGDPVYTAIAPQFLDLSVDQNNNVFTMDNGQGRIYVYNVLGDLLTIFGGIGENKGMFQNPIALEQKDNKVYVLDQTKGTITVFKLTDFGKTLFEASNFYVEGKYVQALDPWKEVLKRDTNLDLAYWGIGLSYYKQQKYSESMKYFKLGYAGYYYSKALKEYRTQFLRDNFSIMMGIILAFIVLLLLTKRPRKRFFANFKEFIDA